MKKFTTLPLAAALLTGCPLLILSLSAWAQENDDPSAEAPAELDEVVVTASLEPLQRAEVTSSLTVITREEIEARQVKYVGDLLRDVPGFSVSQSGGPGTQTQVRVRGAEANQLLVLVDGVRANDPANSDEFQWQFALASDIERIEIVRGPQSAIWGSDAMAGVVNIIRRRDVQGGNMRGAVEIGSFATRDLSAGGAWTGDGLRLRAGVAYHETDGINIARQGPEEDGAENATADLGLEWDVTESVTLLASGQFVDATSDFDATDFFVTGLPVDADRVAENEQAYWRGEVRIAPGGAWSGSVSLNYSDTETTNFADGVFDTRTAAEVLEFRARASTEWAGRSPGTSHRLTFALDERETDFVQRGTATDFGDPNQDQSLGITGVAAEYLGQPVEGLTWTASARWDDNDEFENIGTWRLGFVQEVDEGVRVRGSLGTGSKTPTFIERFGFFPDFFVGNPDLVPEESRGWEFGVESDWLDGDLTLGAVYFDSVLENEINGFFFDPALGASTAINEDTDSDRSGFELTGRWAPIPSLLLSASYTYTDATQDLGEGQSEREVRRPRHMGSLNADWRFAGDRGNLNLNVNHTGEQLDTFFDPVTFVGSTVTLDAFTVVDLAASWRLTDSLEVVARAANLTDEDYEEVLGYARPGAAYYAGLRGRFDF